MTTDDIRLQPDLLLILCIIQKVSVSGEAVVLGAIAVSLPHMESNLLA